MASVRQNKKRSQYKYIVCTFQGGGALGAYQTGVLHALDDASYFPNWFIGTSIGAINAAIAAGNPEHLRVEKMYEFWDSIITPASKSLISSYEDTSFKKLQHWLSAHSSIFFGQPGFFTPRYLYPEFGVYHSADCISYYDTSPLRSTLEHFVDFDRINNKKTTRLSVGAVEISSGEMVYFDSEKEKIGPEHIMASGALPPAFPAVEVNGKLYWDGGISNNTPLGYVLGHQEQEHILCFMVNLFNSYGLNPSTLDEVLQRKKDIEYSSKFHKVLQLHKEIQELKNSIHLLSQYVPTKEKNNPDLKLCMSRGYQSTISLVHFLYQEDISELSTKDCEFSYKTIHERIKKGYHDGKKALKSAPWMQPITTANGIAVYDMSSINTTEEDNYE